MASDDEDSETVGDGEFDNEYEENEIDEDILDAIEAGVEEASEGESVRSLVVLVVSSLLISSYILYRNRMMTTMTQTTHPMRTTTTTTTSLHSTL